MIKKALEYLVSLKSPEVIEHNGLKYSIGSFNQLPEDEPAIFKTKSLASVVELINKESAHPKLNSLIIHVESPTKVKVLTTLREKFERFYLYSAEIELPYIPFGQYQSLEAMNILLKSAFGQTGTTAELIKLLGNIQEEEVQTTTDDGFSQKVTAKTGIATVSKVTIEPIARLAPYRTFIEVEQPESEFLLRLKKGPEAALFEADGGAWKLAARKNIKAYFEEMLKGLIEQGKVIVTE